MEIPDSFICPISHEIMSDPVIDSEGNSYERAYIIGWLKTNDTSPYTRNKIYASGLIPNRAMKRCIEEFKLKHPIDKKEKSQKTHMLKIITPGSAMLNVKITCSYSLQQQYHIQINISRSLGINDYIYDKEFKDAAFKEYFVNTLDDYVKKELELNKFTPKYNEIITNNLNIMSPDGTIVSFVLTYLNTTKHQTH